MKSRRSRTHFNGHSSCEDLRNSSAEISKECWGDLGNFQDSFTPEKTIVFKWVCKVYMHSSVKKSSMLHFKCM